MPHSKFLSRVFQVRFWCYKKQIWSTHRVDWEDDLKFEDDLQNEGNLKKEENPKIRVYINDEAILRMKTM